MRKFFASVYDFVLNDKTSEILSFASANSRMTKV